MTTYKIQDREAGNVMETGLTLEEAEKQVAAHEAEDKADGNYTEDFYEIVEEAEKEFEITGDPSSPAAPNYTHYGEGKIIKAKTAEEALQIHEDDIWNDRDESEWNNENYKGETSEEKFKNYIGNAMLNAKIKENY